jgi:hypothetical protein
MQDDTRNLTVAREHLKSTYEEVMRAQGWADRDTSLAALNRAVDHLNLVVRRLEQQRNRIDRADAVRAVEKAFAGAQTALQGVHSARNSPETMYGPVLEQVRLQVNTALEGVEEACRLAEVGE